MSAKLFFLCTGIALCFGTSSSQGVLLNSWENDVEGWGIIQGAYSSAGFDTTIGVTDQTYSWIISGGSANPDYSAFMGGPSTMALTSILSTTDKILIDVTIPTGGDFGWFQQWSAVVNNADTGYTSLDGYSYSQSPTIGDTVPDTLEWTIPAAMRATLAASSEPTSIVLQLGGGTNDTANNTMYIDNLRTIPIPEPTTATLILAGLSGLGVLGSRRKR